MLHSLKSISYICSMYTQVLGLLRAEIRAADQAHAEAVAAARQGESQLWQERLQKAEAASQQQVCPCSCLHSLLMPLACKKAKFADGRPCQAQ